MHGFRACEVGGDVAVQALRKIMVCRTLPRGHYVNCWVPHLTVSWATYARCLSQLCKQEGQRYRLQGEANPSFLSGGLQVRKT